MSQSVLRPLGAVTARRAGRADLVRPRALSTSTYTPKKVVLGESDLVVPEICLGTMTWGQQNSEAEAHEQRAAALLNEQLCRFGDEWVGARAGATDGIDSWREGPPSSAPPGWPAADAWPASARSSRSWSTPPALSL